MIFKLLNNILGSSKFAGEKKKNQLFSYMGAISGKDRGKKSWKMENSYLLKLNHDLSKRVVLIF